MYWKYVFINVGNRKSHEMCFRSSREYKVNNLGTSWSVYVLRLPHLLCIQTKNYIQLAQLCVTWWWSQPAEIWISLNGPFREFLIWAGPFQEFPIWAGIFQEFPIRAGLFQEFSIWCWPIQKTFEKMSFLVCFPHPCVSFWLLTLLKLDDMDILQKNKLIQIVQSCVK